MDKKRFLIVGLGNPGDQYKNTRHNVGFMLLDEKFAKPKKLKWNKSALGDYVENEIGNHDEGFFIRPTTYMNDSGRMVRDFSRNKNIPLQHILVCLDDLALPLAKLRLRPGGSSGGHKGLQSVIDHIGTQDIPRLRIGIGPLPPGKDAVDFVLGKFSKGERSALDRALDKAYNAVYNWAAYGIEQAMNLSNAPEPVGENN